MNNNLELVISQTRVKKYKNYRSEIKKEALALNKKIEDKDELKNIEKAIRKIDPELLISDKESKFFMDVVVNENHDQSYIKKANFLITNIKNNNLQDILKKTETFEDDIESFPSFDKKGNITVDWLKKNDSYNKLEEMKKWSNFIQSNTDTIKTNIQEKIYKFKDVLYQTQDSSFVKKIMPNTVRPTKLSKNKNNKLIFHGLVFLFLFATSMLLLFLILFLTGV